MKYCGGRVYKRGESLNEVAILSSLVSAAERVSLYFNFMYQNSIITIFMGQLETRFHFTTIPLQSDAHCDYPTCHHSHSPGISSII